MGGFVRGRDNELTLGEDLIARLSDGHGFILVVEGSAGIGKSALVERWRAGALERAIFVRIAHAEEIERTRPLAVISDALDAAVPRYQPVADDAPRAQDLTAAIDLLVEGIECAAASRPMLLALEDLHWADEGTLLTLHQLSRRIPELSVGLVLTARPSPRGPELSRLIDAIRSTASMVILGP